MTSAPNSPLAKKKCIECGESKPRKEFGRSRLSKDGYMHACNSCRLSDRLAKRKHLYRTGPREEYDTIVPLAAAPDAVRQAYWGEVRRAVLHRIRDFDKHSRIRQLVYAKQELPPIPPEPIVFISKDASPA